MSLLQRWGLGVDLNFNAGDATVQMARTHQAVGRLRGAFQEVGSAVSNFASRVGQVGMVLAPLAAAFGMAIGRGSQLAADLEAQALTMRVLIGDAGKAAELMDLIRQNAAATPFEEGDLIEGSKRLLRLTGDNIGRNMELLGVMETMAALSPGKSVTDAVEALLDATSGGGFERLKEFGISLQADDFKTAGAAGSAGWATAVIQDLTSKMATATRGEDLVGALSRTFIGRVSTLGDSFKGVLRELGEVFNREIGPMLEPITARVSSLAPAVRRAAEDLTASIRGMVTRAQPWIDRIASWWDGLGEGGQAAILQAVLALGAFSSVAVPVGGALGAVGFAVAALVGALASAWPVIASMGGALAAMAAPEVLGALAAGLLAVTTIATALYAGLSREGEAPIETLRRVAGTVGAEVVDAFNRARVVWGEFAAGFAVGWTGMEAPIARVRDSLAPFTAKVGELWAMFAGPDGQQARTLFHAMGVGAGFLASVLISKVAAALGIVAAAVDVLAGLWRPMVLAVNAFLDGLLGLVTGSMSAEQAIVAMMRGITGVIVGLVNGVFQVLAGAVELLLRTLVLSLSGIPGMEGILEATGNLGADGISRARASFERETSNAIAGINLAENRRNGAQAERSAPVVNVSPQVEAQVAVTSRVEIDGRELARAQGAARIRTGQRQGETMPAEARGRVLRGGTVQTLTPAEVW